MFSANLLHLERDTTVGTFRARFLEQRRHGDREAVRPGAAGVLASNPVQPALSSASEREVGGVDGENAAFHQDAVVKPLREGDAHAADVAGAILELAVAVDPGEGGLDRVTRADVGLDRRRLQTVEGIRSEERRVGKEWVRTGRFRGW